MKHYTYLGQQTHQEVVEVDGECKNEHNCDTRFRYFGGKQWNTLSVNILLTQSVLKYLGFAKYNKTYPHYVNRKHNPVTISFIQSIYAVV